MHDWRVRFWYVKGSKAYDNAKLDYQNRGGRVVIWQDSDWFVFDVKFATIKSAEALMMSRFLETLVYPDKVTMLLIDFTKTGKPKKGKSHVKSR